LLLCLSNMSGIFFWGVLCRGQEAVGASPAEMAIIHGAGMVTPTFRTRGREPRYVSLDYAEGTPCDLDAVNRSTVVDLYCGPK